MKYKVKSEKDSTVKITIDFSPEEFEEANKKAYLKNRSRYAVNGFRKGKAPLSVLELYYGKGLFYEEALNLLYQEHYPEILKKEEKKFTAVGECELALGENFSPENVQLIATVPVKPDVTIGAYTGIKIPKVEYTVTDSDVEKELESIRERLAEKLEIKDRAAQLSDCVNIDFVGRKDGVEFEGGSAKGYELELGSHSFIPGFEEGIVGMNQGETKELSITFPEDYSAEELKGKEAVFSITLNKIEEKKLPELDEAFAKKMGSDSVEDYKAKVRERLEKSAKSREINENENKILTEIAKSAKCTIPKAMINAQSETTLQRMEYNFLYQGVKLDDYLSYIGKTREEYKESFKEDSERAVLHQLIVEKLIKLEKIEATKEEIDEKVKEQASEVGKEPEEYRKSMDPRQLEYIENDIKVTKLFEFLTKNNEMVLEEPETESSKTEEQK